MYLKSIEVNGFKSFANKIVFDFNDGITAIVGPNGSGKSNVGDAVRWVLGEQSAKQLRGSKMEDVIFSGTEVRKAQSSAYVAITLDNSDHVLPIDYEEVKVARRVYRSGESEYLINGTNCRLKDVQELFFDTGIGKEGYSIIGQGQIDKILSGKPEERRELFDEAAGIVKFKKRKKTAEKNLEDERLNLSRINDILKEIEHQIQPLEHQSKAAREYLSLKESLKSFEVNMFLMEYDRIHDTTNGVEDKISIASEQLDTTNNEYNNTKDEYDKLEAELETRNNSIDSTKNDLSETKIDCEKLEGQIKVLNEQLISFTNNNKHYEDRIKTIKDDIANRNNELETCKSEYTQNENKIDEINELKHSLGDKFNEFSSESNSYTTQIDDIQKKIYTIMNDNSDLKSQIERLETLLEQVNIKRVQLNQRLLEQKTKEGSIQSEIERYNAELNEICNQITNFTNIRDSSKKDIASLQADIDKNKNDQNSYQQNIIREKSKLDNLKNLTERYEGYGISIKKIMEQKSTTTGILGVVADIIKVAPEHETAIEIALGGIIQNIVTDNETTAKHLIEFLKKNKFGRATFLPLTTVTVRGTFSHSDALNEKGAIGLAHNLISTDSKYNALIESLVGKVLVVDNIDNAINIAKKYKNSIKIVTIDGELLNPGGSMSGGAYKNSSNLLGRRRELEDIENNITELSKKLDKVNYTIEVLRANRQKLQSNSDEANEKLQKLFIMQNTAKLNLNQAEAKNKEISAFYASITDETNSIVTEEKDLKNDIAVLQKKQEENNAQRQESEVLITELTDKLNTHREDEKNYTTKLSELSANLSGFEQKRQFILDNSRRVTLEITKLDEELKQLTDNLTGADEKMTLKTSEINDTNSYIADKKKIISELEASLNTQLEERDSITKQHKSFFTKREELSSQISLLDKELFRLNNQKDKLCEQLDSFVNYMWEEYELTYGQSLQYRDEELGAYAQIKKRTSELKAQIKALGDVNVNAIEDYKNLSERYTLLKTQHDDLIESEKVLINIIEDLDIEMRKQFEEKFTYIKSQFDVVFKELFGGGKGTLELIEEDDVLEAGIRIIAQPPGKKLQNMMQMSGGEKALTAIALLFAIQNLKPSPFCLLDEIEAALDDANVKRYAEYLNKLTKHTQFIVITHRRGTMASADILYGITMQEKGVSTLVSVNLIENQLDK